MFDVWLENRTPFEAATHVQVDSAGQEVLVIVISATFAAQEGGSLDLAAQQVPVCFTDEYLGDPRSSSVRVEADIFPVKPVVDVIISGAAYAPGGRPSPEVLVGINLADIRKVLRVTGDRDREYSVFSEPVLFNRMPIVYERAFGGTTDTGDVYVKNPVGIGYRGAISADPSILTKVPNVEYANKRAHPTCDNGVPAGFGIVGRGWAPRLAFAGTYDQAWIDGVWPLPPADFDPRHNQSAPPDQQTKEIRGGEAVSLVNLTPSGRWNFRLPQLDFQVRLIFGDRVEKRGIRIDTVLIDTELQTVTLKARFSVQTVRNAPKLREVVLGYVTPGRVYARLKKKNYINHLDGDGTLVDRSTFRL